MPKRPKQHEIDELAQRVFRDALPPSWIVNCFHRDYGKDFFVEIVDSQVVSGNVFIVQLKGTEKPRKNARRNSIAVPIRREHLTYYLEVLPVPVFVVGVDVIAKEAYYEFVQGHLARNPKVLGDVKEGTARLPLKRGNSLRDTARLVEEVRRAWELMRDKYPGSVSAAVRLRAQALERLDPRFNYEIAIKNGNEHITVHPKEPVEFTLKLSALGESAHENLRKFLDAGIPLVAGNGVTIKAEGSPVFGAMGGEITTLKFEAKRPVEVRLFAVNDHGERVYLPEFRGNLEGGSKEQRFVGQLPGCPLDVRLKREAEEGGAYRLWLECGLQMSRWHEQPLAALPWLDQLNDFIAFIKKCDASIGIILSALGNTMIDAVGITKGAAAQLGACLPFLQMLMNARQVCRALELNVLAPASWSDADLNDLDELYGLVKTGRHRCARTGNLRVTIDGILTDQKPLIEKEGPVRFSPAEAKYDFLGVTFDFSEVVTEYSDWREARVSETILEGKPCNRIELLGCTRTYIWKRFLPSTEAGVEEKREKI